MNEANRTGHLGDDDIVFFLDGELPSHEAERVRKHLSACWACRTAAAETEAAVLSSCVFRRRYSRPNGRLAPGKTSMRRLRRSKRGSRHRGPALADRGFAASARRGERAPWLSPLFRWFQCVVQRLLTKRPGANLRSGPAIPRYSRSAGFRLQESGRRRCEHSRARWRS